MLGCIYKEKAELVGGQPNRLRLVRHPGPANRGGGGVGEDLGVVDAVVVEAGQRGQFARNGGWGCGAAGAGLRFGGEVPYPEVDVVALGGQGVDVEAVAPCGPGLEVAAVGGRGVLRVAQQPTRGEAYEGVVLIRSWESVQGAGAGG